MANTKKIDLPPAPTYDKDLPYSLTMWLQKVRARVGEGPFMLKGYKTADLPDPKEWGDSEEFASIVWVTDMDGTDPGLAFSDGTNWRRVRNNGIF